MLKSLFVAPLKRLLRITAKLRESSRRLYAHSALAADLKTVLPSSVVALGRSFVYGTAAVHIGENVLLYPALHLETQDEATVSIGEGVVLSRGVHLVAMAGITIGKGSMIGEYTSIRDANHLRQPDMPMRDAGHIARPIIIEDEVWIGRGVTVLGGVTIGFGATVGANAVVTRDIAPGAVVAGAPAKPIQKRVPNDMPGSRQD